MNETNSNSDLQSQKKALLDTVSLLTRLNAPEAKNLFNKADPAFISRLLSNSPTPSGKGHSRSLSKCIEKLSEQSDSFRTYQLTSDIEILESLKSTGKEVISNSDWGTTEAAFPVMLLGQPVYCLFTGPIKIGEFSDTELKALAQCANLSNESIGESVEAVHPVASEDIAQIFNLYRAQAHSMGIALAHHIRTQELTEQVIQSERTRSLGTLSSGISHHFNGLLSVILGYASYIQNREELSEEAADSLHKVIEAAQRGRRLTEELLSFAGSETEEEAICQVHDNLSNVISLLESEKSGHLYIDTVFEADVSTVMAIPSDVHQIVFNLLSITMDSLEDKSSFTVHTSNTELDIENEKLQYLRIAVYPTAHKDGVTTPWTPSAEVKAIDDQQQEMRLSSLYGMIRRLDGSILMDQDEQSNGLEILIPICEEMAEPSAQKKVKPRQIASTIWIVDDDPLFRDMCAQVLQDDGHSIQQYEDGSQFIKAWGEHAAKPDLVVLDFSMPEYNGLELREWLIEQKAPTPVVLVSGLAPNQPDIKKALTIKKTYFLQKPFSYRELSDMASVAMGETLIGE